MKKILVVILEGVELFELAPFTDVFGWNSILKKEEIIIETCGFKNSIKSCWNLRITPEIVLDPNKISNNFSDFLKEYSAVIIPGGFGNKGFFEYSNSFTLNFILNHFLKNNLFIVGICTGSLILKINGILKNKRATTYLRENERYFKQLFGDGTIPIKDSIVIDENIITSSGPSTATEIAFYLLKKFSSFENCEIIKKEMGFLN